MESRNVADRSGSPGHSPTSTDLLIEQIAARQHGVVSRAQLSAAGVADHRIDYRIGCGRLRVLHRGVFQLGPLRSPLEREAAALLACGAGAALSHQSAAALSRFLLERGEISGVHVTVRGRHPAPGRGVIVHRVRHLPADEVTTISGLAVTTPARTLLDLAAHIPADRLEQCIAGADRDGLVSPAQVRELLRRYPARNGARRLRALVEATEGPAFTRSEAEARFLALVRRAELPLPQTNARIRGFEVDALWRAEQVVVEVDGQAYHGSAGAFEQDRRRDAVLIAAGYRVVRITWRQLVRTPEAVLVRLAQVLTTGSAGSGSLQ